MNVPRPKRIRNYSAERARRNELARLRGFSSLDTQAKARRKGEYPSARAIRTDPEAAERARKISDARVAEKARKEAEKKVAVETAAAGARDSKQLAAWDKKSAKWASAHSKQDGTVFDPNWPAKRRADYYRAFVQWWSIPNDERNFADTYYYMSEYEGFDVQSYDDNPYSHD